MTETQQNVLKVLERMMDQVRDNEDDAEAYADYLDDMLDDMLGEDIFGTEGQCDPRGDRREGDWSMWDVEGVDHS